MHLQSYLLKLGERALFCDTEHISSGMHCRDISLNVKYLALLRNARDPNQFFRFEQQVYPIHSVNLYDLYLHATVNPHGIMYSICHRTPTTD